MLNQSLIPEFRHEGASTRKMLERVPAESFGWKPHKKSMTLARLAAHVAEIPHWMTVTLTTDELDFSKQQYKPFLPSTREELLDLYQKKYDEALATLEKATDETLLSTWTMRNGDHVIFSMPRMAALRSFVMNHLVHHRGQLSVYLRLLDVPVPGMYGPSNDDR